MEIGGEKFINSDDILTRIEELERQAPDGDESEVSSELDELRELSDLACLEERSLVFYLDSYFSEAMEEYAYDVGVIQRDSEISNYVNWDSYADGMQMDYTEYTIGGYTYWARG